MFLALLTLIVGLFLLYSWPDLLSAPVMGYLGGNWCSGFFLLLKIMLSSVLFLFELGIMASICFWIASVSIDDCFLVCLLCPEIGIDLFACEWMPGWVLLMANKSRTSSIDFLFDGSSLSPYSMMLVVGGCFIASKLKSSAPAAYLLLSSSCFWLSPVRLISPFSFLPCCWLRYWWYLEGSVRSLRFWLNVNLLLFDILNL